MTQILKGETFSNGEQVTGARLNQLVDSSVILVGAISEQTSITANTLEATDSTIVNDSGTLKKATIGDILNSNLPISTSSVTGGAGVDLTITPAAGRKVDIAGAFESDSNNTTGNSSVVGNATVGGTLNVTGATTLAGGISGNTTVNGNVTLAAGKTLTLASAPTSSLEAATKGYVDGNSVSKSKAWVKFNGANGTISASYNVTSVTRTAVGTYSINFTTAIADANYVVVGSCLKTNNPNYGYNNFLEFNMGWIDVNSQTTTTASITASCIYINQGEYVTNSVNIVTYDPASVYVLVFGN